MAFARLSVVVALLGAHGALAADTFSDDFELGTLARWPQQTAQPSVTLSPLAAASHRGERGLRLSDDNTNGSDEQGYVGFVPPAGVARFYFRFWLRLAAPRVTGEVVVCELERAPVNSVSSVLDLRFTLTRSEVSLAGYDVMGNYHQDGTAPFTAEAWHLVEGAMLGLGTTSGSRMLWVDGARAATGTGRDFSGITLGPLKVGEPYADTIGYRGDLDVDDFRAGVDPPASHLVLTGPATGVEGACVPLELSLADSEAVAAAAPYPLEVSLDVSGTAGELFSNVDCTTSVPAASVPSGAQRATFYVRPRLHGPVTLTASHPDFFWGQHALTLEERPQGDDGLTPFRGWGCQSAGAAQLTAAALVLALRRRRRSR